MSDLAPRFLSVQDVLDIQRTTIDRHGGAHGIRDIALLEAAVAMPAQRFDDDWLHEDTVAMAAAYLFHLVRNYGFIDGNKRVGLGACLVFLAVNGVSHRIEPNDAVRVVLAVASGSLGKGALTDWLRDRVVAG